MPTPTIYIVAGCEPGIYQEGKFGVRSEINVYVSDKDIEVTGQPIQTEIIPIPNTPRCLRLVRNRHHPADAKPVFKHSEFGRPKCLLKRHCHFAAVGKRVEDALGFLLVRNDN